MAFVLGLFLVYQHRILAVSCFHTDNFTFWIENMLVLYPTIRILFIYQVINEFEHKLTTR